MRGSWRRSAALLPILVHEIEINCALRDMNRLPIRIPYRRSCPDHGTRYRETTNFSSFIGTQRMTDLSTRPSSTFRCGTSFETLMSRDNRSKSLPECRDPRERSMTSTPRPRDRTTGRRGRHVVGGEFRCERTRTGPMHAATATDRARVRIATVNEPCPTRANRERDAPVRRTPHPRYRRRRNRQSPGPAMLAIAQPKGRLSKGWTYRRSAQQRARCRVDRRAPRHSTSWRRLLSQVIDLDVIDRYNKIRSSSGRCVAGGSGVQNVIERSQTRALTQLKAGTAL